MRVAIIGNSGSGKSTLAAWIAARFNVPSLDLDTAAWVPGQVAVARPVSEAAADVRSFCAGHKAWVVEGCYANLVGVSLEFRPLLLFLNPGVERGPGNLTSTSPDRSRTRTWSFCWHGRVSTTPGMGTCRCRGIAHVLHNTPGPSASLQVL